MIRRYQKGEALILKEIFYSSIRENATAYYAKDQLEVWASDEIDNEQWRARIEGINPYVLIEDNEILGYADLQQSGYMDHFFVKGGCAKKGVGSRLMKHILEEAKNQGINELTSDVSLAAQGFFEKYGFSIVKRKTVTMRGVELENALMKKVIE